MSDSPQVFQKMADVIAALDYIPKQRSKGVSYEFRSIDALMNHLHGPLAEHGLFLSPRVLDDWRSELIPGTKNRQQTQVTFRVCIDVYAGDGSHVTLGPGLAQAQDYGDKAAYQAQQNAIKYLLLEAFCIPTAEQDMDGRQPDEVPATPVERGDVQQQAFDAVKSLNEEGREQVKEWIEAEGLPEKFSQLTDEEAKTVIDYVETIR